MVIKVLSYFGCGVVSQPVFLEQGLHYLLYFATEAVKPLFWAPPSIKLSGVSRAAKVSCFSFVDTNIHGLG